MGRRPKKGEWGHDEYIAGRMAFFRGERSGELVRDNRNFNIGYADAMRETDKARGEGLEDFETFQVFHVKLAATAKTGKRANMNNRHNSHVLKYVRLLGWHALIADIQDTDFEMIDYFYREHEDGSIGRWEDFHLRTKEKEWLAIKNLLPDIVSVEEVFSSADIQAERLAKVRSLAVEHGPTSREVREYAWKNGIKLF